MPVPGVPEEVRANLALLVRQEPPVVREFCRLASQYFKQEVNPKVFNSAANKLGAQPTQVEDAVQAVVFLLVQCSQTSTTTAELLSLSTSSLGFTEEAAKVLVDAYTDNQPELKEYLKSLSVKVPQYKNLEWRFDILVGSRALHHTAEPLLTLQLSLDAGKSQASSSDEGGCEKLLLQTDPNNLVHMTSVLEDALQEARTHHSRRIHRYLK